MRRLLRAVLAVGLGLTTILVGPASACTMVPPVVVTQPADDAHDAHHRHHGDAAPTDATPVPERPSHAVPCELAVGCAAALLPIAAAPGEPAALEHHRVSAAVDTRIASAFRAPEPPPPRR